MLGEATKRRPTARWQAEDWATGTRLSSPLLAQGDADALAAVAPQRRTAPANADLITPGQEVDQLHILKRGWAYRFKTGRDGKRQIMAVLVPGDVINLDSLMLQPADCGVRAANAVDLVSVRCAQLRDLAAANPGLAASLTRLALVHNAHASQWALVLGAYPAERKIAHLLCELGVRLAGDRQGLTRFMLPLTQEQIGDTLGLTSVHVNRVIRLLRERELIVLDSRTVTIFDLPGLRQLAEFDPAYLHL